MEYINLVIFEADYGERFLAIAPAWRVSRDDEVIVKSSNGLEFRGKAVAVLTTTKDSEEFSFATALGRCDPKEYRVTARVRIDELV